MLRECISGCQLAQGVPVGSVASAIYLERGGNGGELGVSIDAFDVNQGIFVDRGEA